MNSERWQKIKGIFDAALELGENQRAEFLSEECYGDEGLRTEIAEMLDSFAGANDFLESPAAEEVADLILESKERLSAGQLLGRYEIVRMVGAGGMGEVYLAKDKTLGREVAIKILNEELSRERLTLERFKQEAKAVSALNHPNILVIHEFGDSDGLDFIVSEFVEGMTLHESMRASSLTLSEVLEIAIQIASALSAAHSKEIIHRDIKPENIMIRSDGYVKVLDFGLAKLIKSDGLPAGSGLGSHTGKGVILGTVKYMSPEQAKGKKVDRRSDIFSLGVLIFEMLAGRTPFEGKSPAESFANLINAEPHPLRKDSSNAVNDLHQVISKTLQKDNTKRFQSMEELLSELKRLQSRMEFETELKRSKYPEKSHETGESSLILVKKESGEVKDQANSVAGLRKHETTQATAATDLTTRSRFRMSSVFDSIKNHKLIFMIGLVFAVTAAGLGYFLIPSQKKTRVESGVRTIAVLPFINSTRDPGIEYLSEGISESVINSLSQVSGLKVRSRNSAFRFKNDQTDTRTIASQLGVDSLVTGEIKQVGDKFIINIRLIDAADDSQIWGNQYVRSSADIFAAQSEIARAVIQNLRLKLTPTERIQLGKHYTEDAEAYELYLQGRYHYFKLTLKEFQKAIEFYERAIERDPEFALAYAGIADAYRTIPIAGWGVASNEAFPRAKAAAKKALELDPDLAEAHIVLGWVGCFYDWDWETSEVELKRAIELAPNSSDAHRAYGSLLSVLGRHDEAIAEITIARDLDPLSLINNALEGQFLFYAGRNDEAIDRLKKTLEIEPGFWIARNFLGRVYINEGRYEEAIVELNSAIKYSGGGSSEPIMQVGYALAKSGDRKGAEAILSEQKSIAKVKYVPEYSFAMIFNGLGERDKALDYLESSFKKREAQLTFIKIDRRWDPLRSEKRFEALIRKMNLQ